ncbi:hypothetical protein ALC62_05305 [Cyphomyrmex costatus]|uniref:Uncharacterized protein n=1 Tax=Cyphomyrmex costatus TaxID=456900 RepID=A0A195CSW2_9HYME|nr:hypothetical protein ALC62_05305 [Cyphomyrmex costatus]
MWEICRIDAQVRPEIVLCIRFVKKAPSAAIDDRPSSNRKEQVLAIEKEDPSLYLYAFHSNELFEQILYNVKILNFVRQGLEEQNQYASSFLQQDRLEDLVEIVLAITTILENLIVCGLNIHNYDVILLSECLAFYEEICTLESRSYVLSWTLPPPAVIYGAFITKSCAILSRICKLLLRYCKMSPHMRQIMPLNIYAERIRIISIYANDIHKSLWYDEPFSENGNLLKNFSKKLRSDLRDCDLETLLNISNHYAILPFKCTLNISKTSLKINTKEVNIKISTTNF